MKYRQSRQRHVQCSDAYGIVNHMQTYTLQVSTVPRIF